MPVPRWPAANSGTPPKIGRTGDGQRQKICTEVKIWVQSCPAGSEGARMISHGAHPMARTAPVTRPRAATRRARRGCGAARSATTGALDGVGEHEHEQDDDGRHGSALRSK